MRTDATGYKGVDYGKLTAVLIEAFKELAAEKDELRREVDALKAQFARLEGQAALVG